MQRNQIKDADIPQIPAINGLAVEKVTIDALTDKGVSRPSYGLDDGDTFEFPDSIADCDIYSRQVNGNATETLVLGLKNGKPNYLSIVNLRRVDYQFKPVHEVSEACIKLQSDKHRLKAMLGKTIVAEGTTTFQEYIFDKGVRTNELRTRSTAILKFVK